MGFELFPPRSERRHAQFRETVERLAPAASEGFSVTMGAGGTTRAGTHDSAVEVARLTGRPVMAHLTALGLSRRAALETAEGLWQAGIHDILALRGDQPRAMEGPLPPGFAHASDLVAALAERHPFRIAVAAYPEKHPEAGTLDQDIDHLKLKLDAGAHMAYCQFVLDPAAYGRFLEACARHGIDAPIVPGLMPLEGWARVRSFAKANGTTVPDWLERLFRESEDKPEMQPYLAAVATVEQARRLIAYGAPSIHVYTMNRWPLPLALSRLLGRC